MNDETQYVCSRSSCHFKTYNSVEMDEHMENHYDLDEAEATGN